MVGKAQTPVNKGLDELTGTCKKTSFFFCFFFIFFVHFTHTNGKSLLRVFDRKLGPGVGPSLTLLWRFHTYYCTLSGFFCVT